MSRRVVVSGSRHLLDYALVLEELRRHLRAGDVVLHGACRGADRLAGRAAIELGHAVEEWPADWDRHGPAAGPIRNAAMLDAGAGLLIAFILDRHPCIGTWNAIEGAKSRGIEYVQISAPAPWSNRPTSSR